MDFEQTNSVIETDALIVGAGPVGLFQVFELGLLDIRAHVVDSMAQVGGQCVELYPDKPIYDIPALPVCGALELIERLMQQIKPFSPTFHLGQAVVQVKPIENQRFLVQTNAGTIFNARTVIIAAGVGAFLPKKLKLDGAALLEEQSIHYRVRDPAQFLDQDLIIAGGGDSALDWVHALVDKARSIVLVHRSQKFRAAPAQVARMQALCDEYRMQFLEGDIVGLDQADHRLKQVVVRGRDGVNRRLDANHLLVFWGLHPQLGPIANWGLNIDKNQIVVDPARFCSSTPGIYAVGDINTYPGKRKLILSGFHEAALAAFSIREYLYPEQKVYLQYTTTSPTMHKRLGVETDPEFKLSR
jgi:thioredoxin reductase (NADPH)